MPGLASQCYGNPEGTLRPPQRNRGNARFPEVPYQHFLSVTRSELRYRREAHPIRSLLRISALTRRRYSQAR
jgi:hypothetical protein